MFDTAPPDIRNTFVYSGGSVPSTFPGYLGQVWDLQPRQIAATVSGTYPPDVNEGASKVRLVYNDSGSTISRGMVVTKKAGEQAWHVRQAPTSSNPALVVGTACADIATGYCGYIYISGAAELLADGSGAITADSGVIVSAATAGKAKVVAGATDPCFGFTAAEIASGALGWCMLLPRAGA